ncbi:peptidase M16 [Bacteroidota bacterium]|nr:peptidase M16 [Bacteroidota bacterium]
MKKITSVLSLLLATNFSFAYDYPVYSKVLANGLKVIVCERPTGEMIEVQVWYKAGSKDETEGIRGMAHMFEHMMFRGSKNYPGEGDVFLDSMEALGGNVNAYTTFDRTVYHETIPKDKITMVFKMEADRMANLTLSQTTLDVERQVVGEELRNGENNWFQRMHNTVYDQLYPTGHPYRVDVIGYLDQIVSFTTKQCQDFYDKFYSPNNAVLIVVGNVNHDEVFALAEKNFGVITKQIPPIEKYKTPDIFSDSLRQYEYAVDFPVQIYGYIIPKPAVGDSDFYKFLFLKDLLFTNSNSVFNKEIVEDMQAAYQISPLSDDWSLYTNYCELYIIMQAAPGNVKVKKAINTEIQSIIDEGMDAQLMKDYLQSMKAQRTLNLYQNDFVSNELGMAEMYLGDYQKTNDMYEAFEKITPEQLQQTAVKYFNPQNFKVLNIKPTF